MLTIRVDETKCNSCGLCQVACLLGHGTGDSGTKKLVTDLPEPLLRLKNNGQKIRIDICRHCERPVCVDACVSGALQKDQDLGVVTLNHNKCVGCWSCIMECPFGALQLKCACRHNTEQTNIGKAYKCDGCQKWDKPLCASFCPTGAIQANRRKNGLAATKRRRRAVLMEVGSRKHKK